MELSAKQAKIRDSVIKVRGALPVCVKPYPCLFWVCWV
jgi:hypothetical protein